MTGTDFLIILYGSPICGLLIYLALTLRGISQQLELLHLDLHHHIYKDRY